MVLESGCRVNVGWGPALAGQSNEAGCQVSLKPCFKRETEMKKEKPELYDFLQLHLVDFENHLKGDNNALSRLGDDINQKSIGLNLVDFLVHPIL